jgi:GTP cyclohydrolase I
MMQSIIVFFFFFLFSHMCMVMRGAQKVNSRTTTASMLGTFNDDVKTRQEFLILSGSISRHMQ